MGNSWFQFQQFRVYQDRCAMKISTDAVMLGALINAENPTHILDIGTGTGVIALMLAQRFPKAKVTAIEIDEDAASQADENFRESQFASRLLLIHGKLQDFPESEKYDLIVSNPPFFPDHLKSQDPKRNKALHTDELSFEELIKKCRELLAESGAFWVILPPRQMKFVEVIAEKSGLCLRQTIGIRDSEKKPIHREVCEFTFGKGAKNEIQIALKDENFDYSGSYKNLLSGFLIGY
ncbi:tRNA1(Val) (adenine(37)-N6)-methyltransferase [Algoriphagus sp.]|uniref:tRNA1(Val) (adenine(37)-N6)-methyltransferase n=1 Tax=Algoriphagus sp. TaxID=1872435 RepID=UPI00391D6AA5